MNSYGWIKTFKKFESLKCDPEDIISFFKAVLL